MNFRFRVTPDCHLTAQRTHFTPGFPTTLSRWLSKVAVGFIRDGTAVVVDRRARDGALDVLLVRERLGACGRMELARKPFRRPLLYYIIAYPYRI